MYCHKQHILLKARFKVLNLTLVMEMPPCYRNCCALKGLSESKCNVFLTVIFGNFCLTTFVNKSY